MIRAVWPLALAVAVWALGRLVAPAGDGSSSGSADGVAGPAGKSWLWYN